MNTFKATENNQSTREHMALDCICLSMEITRLLCSVLISLILLDCLLFVCFLITCRNQKMCAFPILEPLGAT